MVLGRLIYFVICVGFAKVDPPNYNFSLDALDPFKPGSTIEAVKAKYGEGEPIGKAGAVEGRKYYVSHIRYKFPVFVQFYEGNVVDMYATLPKYFLHDIFHQSLINRLGKQQQFGRKDGTAQYIWEKDGVKHVYEGACTITCFPQYYSMQYDPMPKGAEMVKPMLSNLNESKP